MARPTGRPVREEVLAAALPLIQSVGVDGFSFNDIAKQLDIKAPSIHHHFRSKADLVCAVTEQYRADFAHRVDQIEAGPATERVLAYAELFDEPAASGLLCLCGSIAAEWPTIAPQVRSEVERFFEEQHEWLVRELARGVEAGELDQAVDPAEVARAMLAALEGSMFIMRASGTTQQARSIAATFLDVLRR